MKQVRAVILVTLLVASLICVSRGSPFDAHRSLALSPSNGSPVQTDTVNKAIQCVFEDNEAICDDGTNTYCCSETDATTSSDNCPGDAAGAECKDSSSSVGDRIKLVQTSTQETDCGTQEGISVDGTEEGVGTTNKISANEGCFYELTSSNSGDTKAMRITINTKTDGTADIYLYKNSDSSYNSEHSDVSEGESYDVEFDDAANDMIYVSFVGASGSTDASELAFDAEECSNSDCSEASGGSSSSSAAQTSSLVLGAVAATYVVGAVLLD